MTDLQQRDREHVLASADWLLEHLDDPDLVLLEVDDLPDLYHRGHLPGAQPLDWFTDLQHPVQRDLPDSDALEKLWTRLGVTPRSTVVLYGDLHNWLAAYGYWLFRMAGLSDVRLLDGGRQIWIERGLTITTDQPAPHRHAKVPAVTWSRQHVARRQEVLRAARAGQLLDVRTPQEYTGEWLTEPEFPGEAAHRPGHIPGAFNLPWDFAVDNDGLLRSTSALKNLVAAAGLSKDAQVVTYCRIGERSAHTWIVLHDLLGHPHVANYNGSWTEWGSMTGMPIELGRSRGRMPEHCPH